MTRSNAASASGFLCGAAFSPAALAGPAAGHPARHIQAVASRDVAAITAYAPAAVLTWVGGPHERLHRPRTAEIWAKLAKAQGPLRATVSNLQESTNPKGSTVTADACSHAGTRSRSATCRPAPRTSR